MLCNNIPKKDLKFVCMSAYRSPYHHFIIFSLKKLNQKEYYIKLLLLLEKYTHSH